MNIFYPTKPLNGTGEYSSDRVVVKGVGELDELKELHTWCVESFGYPGGYQGFVQRNDVWTMFIRPVGILGFTPDSELKAIRWEFDLNMDQVAAVAFKLRFC